MSACVCKRADPLGHRGPDYYCFNGNQQANTFCCQIGQFIWKCFAILGPGLPSLLMSSCSCPNYQHLQLWLKIYRHSKQQISLSSKSHQVWKQPRIIRSRDTPTHLHASVKSFVRDSGRAFRPPSRARHCIGNESDWNPFQFRQVSAGAERRQDQRWDHVEPLCPGYEVCNGRWVVLLIKPSPARGGTLVLVRRWMRCMHCVLV